MKIEKVIFNITLKAGHTVWEKGSILTDELEPIPDVILNEIMGSTGSVTVLKQGRSVITKPVLVQKEKLKEATTTTTVSTKKEPKVKKEVKTKKAKPKLKQRKKFVKRKK